MAADTITSTHCPYHGTDRMGTVKVRGIAYDRCWGCISDSKVITTAMKQVGWDLTLTSFRDQFGQAAVDRVRLALRQLPSQMDHERSAHYWDHKWHREDLRASFDTLDLVRHAGVFRLRGHR